MIHEAAHRFRYLVELLNKSNHGLTVSEIKTDLERRGFEEISVERLRKLLRNMADDTRLNIKRTGTGYGDKWVGKHKAGVMDIVSMTSRKAVSLTLLAETDISQVLPKVIREELEQEQKDARSRITNLRNAQNEGILHWVDRVLLRRPSVRMAVDREEPKIKPEVETAVHHALIDRNPLTISYFSGHLSEGLEEITIYPIGLDCQLRWVTLVCQLAEPHRTRHAKRSAKYGEDYVQLPMHRILKAQSDETGSLPNGFDSQFSMDTYISRAEPDRPRGGNQRFTQGQKIKLVARVTESHANDLKESPLISMGEAQSLIRQDNGWYLLTVEVTQSDNLLWWCVAMAGDLVVIEPASFKQEVMQLLDKGRALYDLN